MNHIHYIDSSLVRTELTHLVDDGNFLLLAQVFIHHVHFWRTDHRFPEWNDGF